MKQQTCDKRLSQLHVDMDRLLLRTRTVLADFCSLDATNPASLPRMQSLFMGRIDGAGWPLVLVKKFCALLCTAPASYKPRPRLDGSRGSNLRGRAALVYPPRTVRRGLYVSRPCVLHGLMEEALQWDVPLEVYARS